MGKIKVLISSAVFIFIVMNAKMCIAITADEVLENYFKAIGGREQLYNIDNIVIKGRIANDSFTTYIFSDCDKTEIRRSGSLLYYGIDKKGRWKAIYNGVVRYLEGQEFIDSETEEIMNNFSLFVMRKNKYTAEYSGERKERGNNYHIIKIKTDNSMVVYLYINDQTWLIDKTKIKDFPGMGGFPGPVIIEYKNYKKYNGLLLPSYLNKISKAEYYPIIYNKVDINKSIDKKLLELPKVNSDINIKNNNGKFSIPFKIDKNGAVILKVKINNSEKKYNFMLDTGAAGSFISNKAASEIGLELFGKYKVSGAGKSTNTVRQTKTEKIDIGDISIYNFCFSVRSNISSHTSDKIDGIIGYDFFSRFVLEINYNDNVIVCYKNGEYVPSAGAVKIPLKIMWNFPLTEVVINDQYNALLFLDVGFRGMEMALFLEFAKKAGIESKRDPQWQSSAVGGSISIEIAKIKSLKIGNFVFNSLSAIVFNKQNMKIDGLIGNLFFMKYKSVVFDYFNKVMWLEK